MLDFCFERAEKRDLHRERPPVLWSAVATSLNPSGEHRLRGLSLWWDTLPGPVRARAGLEANTDVDVAIVGAGFTGLWTAYYLLRGSPGIRVAVLEKEVAGFGASGRNGGWCSALFPVSDARLVRQHGAGTARAMRQTMQRAVDEVGTRAAAEGIDCCFAKGGTIVAARNAAQVQRAHAELSESRALGIGEEDLRWLSQGEAEKVLGVSGLLGATYTPHCAALDPARLVRGLADAVERLGGSIYEGSEVCEIRPGGQSTPAMARTNGGSVRAEVVVRALEGWTVSIPGQERALLPVYSLMIATEPLPDTFWAGAGLAQRETFSDHRHLIIYGQRTADGRLAFGGRGAPYHYGSAVQPSYDRAPQVHRSLRSALIELFPGLRDAAITHAWGGPLGVPRDWFPSVGLDRSTGMAWAGGYVGDGVSTTNLAGRTLADLLLDHETEVLHLPWVAHRSPNWEPEPLRWVEVNAALLATKLADRTEGRRRRPSWLAGHLTHLLGR
jgi:glycine/D-amino acid oxidase-like deaminating enzyme